MMQAELALSDGIRNREGRVTSYSRFFLFLSFWLFNDAMNITNSLDWLRAQL